MVIEMKCFPRRTEAFPLTVSVGEVRKDGRKYARSVVEHIMSTQSHELFEPEQSRQLHNFHVGLRVINERSGHVSETVKTRK